MTRRIRASSAGTFASMRERNFRLFFMGQGVSQVGNWMTLVAQTLLVLHLTDSGVALGVLAAAQFGPVLLLGPWAGLVADRSDKKKLLLAVQSVSMLQSFALAALAFSGSPPVWAVYALASVGGVTIAFDNPARRAFVVEMVDTAGVPNAVGLNTTMMTASRIVGPALAGLLVATAGFGWAFLVDGVSYVAVLVSLVMIRRSELRPVPQTPRGRGQVREGLRYVRSQPELFVPLVMMAVFSVLNFQRLFPEGSPYAELSYPVFAFVGLLPWAHFSTSLTQATPSLVLAGAMLKKTRFPQEVVPLAKVFAALLDLGVGLVILVGLLAWQRIPLHPAALAVPAVFVLQVIFTSGLALLLAAANMFFRDVNYLLQVGIVLAMFATSVVYPISVSSSAAAAILGANPMSSYLDAYREALLLGQWPSWQTLAPGVIGAAVSLLVGAAVFQRAAPRFAEEV